MGYFQRDGLGKNSEDSIRTFLIGLSVFVTITPLVVLSLDIEADNPYTIPLEEVAVNITKTESFVEKSLHKTMKDMGIKHWEFVGGMETKNGQTWMGEIKADGVGFGVECEIIQDYRFTNELVGFCFVN